MITKANLTFTWLELKNNEIISGKLLNVRPNKNDLPENYHKEHDIAKDLDSTIVEKD